MKYAAIVLLLATACEPAQQPPSREEFGTRNQPYVWSYPNGVVCYGWPYDTIHCVLVKR